MTGNVTKNHTISGGLLSLDRMGADNGQLIVNGCNKKTNITLNVIGVSLVKRPVLLVYCRVALCKMRTKERTIMSINRYFRTRNVHIKCIIDCTKEKLIGASLCTCCISTLARFELIRLKRDVFRFLSEWSRLCFRCLCRVLRAILL